MEFDLAASDACRKNNDVQCGPTVQQPLMGGNVDFLHKLVGGPVPAEEFTMPKFEVTSGADFIAL